MDLQSKTLSAVDEVIKLARERGHPHAPLLITLQAWVRTAGVAGVDKNVLKSARSALLGLAEDALEK